MQARIKHWLQLITTKKHWTPDKNYTHSLPGSRISHKHDYLKHKHTCYLAGIGTEELFELIDNE